MGNVRSIDREVLMKNGVIRKIRGRMLRLGKYNSQSEYTGVTLSVDGIATKHSVHRLVALAFIPNPDDLPEVNHKDEDKRNNAVENLEWCDRKYNALYGTANIRKAMTQGKPVLQLKNGEIVNAYPSAGLAAFCTGATQGGISACCRGEIKTSGGYEWKLAPWA